ncbi:prevent-host-death protein [bacterium]|nr:prevent-host-death protein [bacterium]
MKTATIPPLRVEPELREAATNALRDGESLSSFVEDSLRANIRRRQNQKAFLERGLRARDAAKATGNYASKHELMDSLRSILDKAESTA